MALATFSLVAVDSDDSKGLCEFYQAITGWELQVDDGDDWYVLQNPVGATLAFQQIEGYSPPTWPGGSRPQQLHIDFDVPDLDLAEPQVLALGAMKAEEQPSPENFRVYLDPAGHPFCFVRESLTGSVES